MQTAGIVSERSQARTTSILDVLISDMFVHMMRIEAISNTDLVMLAWVYVPARHLIPRSLRGAETLIREVHGSGELKQIKFIALTMASSVHWSPVNRWLGVLLNSHNVDRFNHLIAAKALPQIWYDTSSACRIICDALNAKVDATMLALFFAFIPHDLTTTTLIIRTALNARHEESYVEALSQCHINSFQTETWLNALEADDGYEMIAFMLTLENDPCYVDVITKLLEADDEDAMAVLYGAELLERLNTESFYHAVEDGKYTTVAKLIEYQIFKPDAADIEFFSTDDRESLIDTNMMALLSGAVGKK